MKLLVLLAGLIALCSSSPVSMIPGDNSHYVEGESRYIWMPDGDGVPHLVDLQEPTDQSILNSRNGADNQYWLYSRQNVNNALIIKHGDVKSISNADYRAARPTVVIVHGWNSNGNSLVNTMIRDVFLIRRDCNVIVVDWSALANSNYNTASDGVLNVGDHLGNFLLWLFNNAGGSWMQLHLIGFNLGAHVIGHAGRVVGRVARRVTGLDPAGPRWAGHSLGLTQQSGQYVEAIHTDSGMLGISNRVAHADFYPNGGRNPQPGCSTNACSHSRAYELFASTVLNNHLVGRLCTNINQATTNRCTGTALNMGNDIMPKSGNGIYGLVTRGAWPF